MLRFLLRFAMFTLVVALFAALFLQDPQVAPPTVADGAGQPDGIATIRNRQMPHLSALLEPIGAEPGNPVYLRVFKEEAELELWIDTATGFRLFRTYPICNHSGALGPKLREGDRQAPEGFYRVGLGSLNPNSSYHLSFNLGFPNAYDRSHARTGSFLMIHGACASVGCYAMTDPLIEEIYVLVEAALKAGQSHVDVHAFPFHMTSDRMARAHGAHWQTFWKELEPAYAAFEANRQVPQMQGQGGTYRLVSR